MCSYSPSGRVYTESERVPNNRNKSNSFKNTIKCPFKIIFNQKRSGIYRKKHSILQPVNTTNSCRYTYTCILSSQALRTAVLSSRTQDNVDVKTLSAAIMMLKINLQLPVLQLRPLFTNSVVTNAPITTSFYLIPEEEWRYIY